MIFKKYLKGILNLIVLIKKNVRNDFNNLFQSVTLNDFLLQNDDSEAHNELAFEQVPFNHPLVVMFSSGTTGIPKCIVHSHGVRFLLFNFN